MTTQQPLPRVAPPVKRLGIVVAALLAWVVWNGVLLSIALNA